METVDDSICGFDQVSRIRRMTSTTNVGLKTTTRSGAAFRRRAVCLASISGRNATRAKWWGSWTRNSEHR